MTYSDSTMNGVRQVLTAAGAVIAGFNIYGLDIATTTTLANDLAVALPAVVSIGSIIWSVVVHYGKKKVPLEATAIVLPPSVAAPPVGSKLDLTPLSGYAKVVG